MTDLPAVEQLTPSDANWRSRVIGQSRRATFEFGATRYSLSFEEPQPEIGGPVVRVLAGDGSIWLRSTDWDRFLGSVALYEGVSLATLPAEIAPAVVEGAAEAMLDRLQQLSGQTWNVLEVQAEPAGVPFDWCLGLRLAAEAGGELRCNVATDEVGRERLASLIEAIPLERRGLASQPPLVAAVEIGMTTIPLSELASLRVHDVLMMDVTAFEPGRNGLVRISPTMAWRVTVGDWEVTLVEAKTTGPRPKLSGDEPVVSVMFELGQIAVSFEELAALEPGKRLASEHHEQVRLTLGGRVIGAGELVQLGERLGVRVTDLGTVR